MVGVFKLLGEVLAAVLIERCAECAPAASSRPVALCCACIVFSLDSSQGGEKNKAPLSLFSFYLSQSPESDDKSSVRGTDACRRRPRLVLSMLSMSLTMVDVFLFFSVLSLLGSFGGTRWKPPGTLVTNGDVWSGDRFPEQTCDRSIDRPQPVPPRPPGCTVE